MMDNDEEPGSTQHRDAYKAWIGSQVDEGVLTPRDLAWLKKEPSSLIQFYPIVGLVLGFSIAGAASRLTLQRTFRPWSFTRTIVTGGAAAGGGWWLGDWLHDRAIMQFNADNDNQAIAMVARFKLKSAATKDQIEDSIRQAKRRQQDDQVTTYTTTLKLMNQAETQYAAEVVLETLVSDSDEVHDATSEEIQNAVESIIEEEMNEEGLPLSRHDVDMLVQHQVEYWKGRPITGASDSTSITGGIVGAVSIYGRFMRKPPVAWAWLIASIIPVYAASALWCLGFGRFGGDSPPDDWWTYNIAGMEVRSNIAQEIASNRARQVLMEGDPERIRALLGSRSGSQPIQIPVDVFSRPQDDRLDQSDGYEGDRSR